VAENYLTGANRGDNAIDTSRVGNLLIAHPNLSPNDFFYKTVVYVYLDDAVEGTRAIVLNMPSVLTIREICEKRDIDYPDRDERIYQGGPVAGEAVVMLHTDEWQSRNTTTAGPGYLLSSDFDMFEKLAEHNRPAYYRVFAGIASWAPGQLDMELAGDFPYKSANSWLIARANDDIMFEYEGYYQWDKALELAGQQMFDSFI
jgi:putative transcriptional regulator